MLPGGRDAGGLEGMLPGGDGGTLMEGMQESRWKGCSQAGGLQVGCNLEEGMRPGRDAGGVGMQPDGK